MFSLILVIMVLHVGTTTGHRVGPCPNDAYPHWFKIGPNCAKYFTYALTFDQAELKCRGEAEDGHLISVHDSLTNNDLQILTGPSPHVWIGGLRLPNNGKFVWTDGSKWDYTNWVRGEPKNAHCVQMNWDTPGKWDDIPCSNARGYVCAFKI